MQSYRLRQFRAMCTIAAGTSMLLFSACQMSELTHKSCSDDGCFGHTRVCEKPTVRALAQDLDHLEAHIERYGSVVIQHPSVWGQARLTKHREEFESVMKDDLCKFELTLQGSLSRSDQAYFANSFALGVAASGPQAMSSQAVAPNNANFTVQPITTPTPEPLPAVVLQQNPARLPAAITFTEIQAKGITVEPSVMLNQKARYLNHLHELRRINEGDDTGDSPGYALNLIRVPVSILPGKHTQEGHGAEVTMTLKPYLSEELLPTTFRNLVVNDLLEQIGVPLTQFLNDPQYVLFFKLDALETAITIAKDKNDNAAQKKAENERDRLMKAGNLTHDKHTTYRATVMAKLKDKGIGVPRISATKLRHAKRPFPPSQILDVYGEDETINVARIANETFKHDAPNKYWKHYPDVQGYLQEEISAAYNFLNDPNYAMLWEHCNPALVTAIHGRNIENVEMLRNQFATHARNLSNRDMKEDMTVALAWAVIVESALLNKHLMQDMKESAAGKGCPCAAVDAHGAERWLDCYLPQPSPEARQAFIRYVECRWPIIVFALDPVAEQQNIAESYSQRREMQLALSLAFVSGNISAKNMMQYARRLEMEMETVALNNTVTGFSHGNETFGWRFYPRYQTPDTESNLTVLIRDQLIGGPNRNALLRQRKLEPGQRECTAIVIMPSFVPYATLETSSTWFKLTNPKCKDMTCVDAVKLSARVKAIEKCSPRVIDANCYRDGELERLLNRAKQLETRLPLQTAKVQIPYENTLGGFAMFNTGTTDLAPELYGWYGGPGININGPTTLFLIGNHFSVHQTRVIVGGVAIDPANTEMLSRQVMRVTIPAGTMPFDHETGTFPDCPPPGKCVCPCPAPKKNKKDGMVAFGSPTAADEDAGVGDKKPDPKDAPKTPATQACKELFVHVHVATPYGVTSHMLVPACGATTCPPATPATTPPAGFKCPANPANPTPAESTMFRCPPDAAAHQKAVEAAKQRQKDAEAANEAAAAKLKALKDKADAKAVADLAKAMQDYDAKSKKELEQYKKDIKDRLDKLENEKKKETSAAPLVPQVECAALEAMAPALETASRRASPRA